MFGLGDKDQNSNFTSAYNSGVATQPMTDYQNPNPAPTAAPSGASMPGYDPGNTTPPAQDPASIPSAPPMPPVQSGTETVPLAMPAQAAPAPAPTPAPAEAQPSPMPQISTSQVSLEHAYIATDPPDMAAKPSQEPAKPSAASLFSTNTDDLVKMKQQALQHLEPLIDKLEQTPEEKFRTTMMLIQASDNSELLKDAYDSANAIKDEKAF